MTTLSDIWFKPMPWKEVQLGDRVLLQMRVHVITQSVPELVEEEDGALRETGALLVSTKTAGEEKVLTRTSPVHPNSTVFVEVSDLFADPDKYDMMRVRVRNSDGEVEKIVREFRWH